MFFIDGHCDTITTVLKKNENFFQNSCHIDINRLKKFQNPIQVFSIWLEKEKLKNPFFYTMEAISFFEKEVEKNNEHIAISKSFSDLQKNITNKKISGIIGIEGCEAFEGNIENIYKFIEKGVKVFTITWNYENELGFGASTKIKKGLKPFGKEAIKILDKLNGIIDVSHLNTQGFWDICEITDKPFIASHSNSKKICNNLRNLTDKQIIEVSRRKGIIGLNLYPDFLNNSKNATILDLLKHIEYMLELGAENSIGIGCDFDGIDCTPNEITYVTSITKIYKEIEKNFGDKIAKKIMSDNFFEFLKNNIN